MKAWQFALVAGLVLIAFAGSALAQETRRGPQRPGVFSALDVDGDGVLSEAEIAAASDVLAALAAEGDGTIAMRDLMSVRDHDGVQRAWRRGFTAGRGFGAGWRSLRGPGGPWMRGGGSWASRSRGWAGRPSLRGFSARGRFGAPEAAGEGRARLQGFFGNALFERFDPDDAGFLNADSLPEALWERLAPADADADGRISRAELDAHMESMPPERGRRGRGRRSGAEQEPEPDAQR